MAEEGLASMLGMSRTPVRQAIARLQTEGLVGRHPEGGYRPSVPNLSEIWELYELRRTLEVAALRRPSEHSTQHDMAALGELRSKWVQLQAEQPAADPSFVVLDESFHLGLAEAAGNRTLVDLLGMINSRIRIVRIHDFLTTDRVRQTIEEHLAIASSVIEGHLHAAERQFLEHLAESKRVAEERSLHVLARMASGEVG